jgi:hypothetical protein
MYQTLPGDRDIAMRTTSFSESFQSGGAASVEAETMTYISEYGDLSQMF